MILMDRYGRTLRTLRIIVNMECNLNCIYCHREGVNSDLRRSLLTPKEFKVFAEVVSKLGVERFKLTGGEPLLRSDIVDIVEALASVKPKDLSLTTNGIMLSLYALKLANSGLNRVNVNIPSLNRDRYKYITQVDSLEQVVIGVKTAYDVGLRPITINVVVLKNITENEYENLIDFVSKLEGRLRFIELEPIGAAKKVFYSFFEPVDKIVKKYLEKNCVKMYIRSENARPVYVLSNGVEVEIVKWYKNPVFCMNCDRIRLVFDGTIRSCIATKEAIDITKCLRPEVNMKCLEEAITKVIELRKPFWNLHNDQQYSIDSLIS